MRPLLLLSLLHSASSESLNPRAALSHSLRGQRQVALLFCRYPHLFPGCMNAERVVADINYRSRLSQPHCPFWKDHLDLFTISDNDPEILAPFQIQLTNFPALVLVSDDWAREFPGSLDSFSGLFGWIARRRNASSLPILPAQTHELLSSNESTLLLLHSANPSCADPRTCRRLAFWQSAVRLLALHNPHRFHHLNLSRLSDEERLQLEARLPALHLPSSCSWIIHFREGSYSLAPRPYRIRALRKWVFREEGPWFEVGQEMSELGAFYWEEERRMAGLREERAGKIVGLSGGLAVIVLAFSIFWGLSSSSSMVYADRRLVHQNIPMHYPSY